MNSSETMFVITPERTQRWDICKTDLDIQESIMEAFSSKLVLKSPALIEVGGNYGTASLALANGFEMWSVQVFRMALSSPYRLRDGVHTPVFTAKDLPVLPIFWLPPVDMKLVLGITILREGKVIFAGDHYLAAFDERGNLWRLPISNLYNICRLCHGQNRKNFTNSLDAVRYALDMFSRSEWNADLYEARVQEKTDAMFRFKPTDDGFEQLPIVLPAGAKWTSLCEKVANETITNTIINL